MANVRSKRYIAICCFLFHDIVTVSVRTSIAITLDRCQSSFRVHLMQTALVSAVVFRLQRNHEGSYIRSCEDTSLTGPFLVAGICLFVARTSLFWLRRSDVHMLKGTRSCHRGCDYILESRIILEATVFVSSNGCVIRVVQKAFGCCIYCWIVKVIP